ncbi:MAG TPA: NAD(P)-dependent oxidoreductase [Hyphomicrobiaceae bacterium]|nr:NAD(P)-dependent oxidoreductase [Hyphomicrobiaceae bacterium]
MPATIGFVGLGAMGAEMAETLVSKQWRVVGYDVRREAIDRLVKNGGHAAASAAEAAKGAEALVLMVVNAEQAENVLFNNGALEALPAGGTVILMSTCAPSRVEAIAARVEASGRKFVDAPVSGGVTGAKGGTLTIMAAAPQATFDASRPLLEAMGSNLFYLGQKPGQGSAMKIVNQLMAGANLAVAAEAIAFAERAGVDTKVAYDLLTGSAAGSWMLKARGPRMIDYDNVVTSAVEIFVKDLGLVLDSGRALRMGLPIAATAHQQYLAAAGMGLGQQDDSQVVQVYRSLSGKAKT